MDFIEKEVELEKEFLAVKGINSILPDLKEKLNLSDVELTYLSLYFLNYATEDSNNLNTDIFEFFERVPSNKDFKLYFVYLFDVAIDKVKYNNLNEEVKELETISSEDSLLGILLEAVEDSYLTKEEVVVKLQQELKQLENNVPERSVEEVEIKS